MVSSYQKNRTVDQDLDSSKVPLNGTSSGSFLQRHWKHIVLAAALAVIIATVVPISIKYVQEREQQAAEGAAEQAGSGQQSKWNVQMGLQPGSKSPPTLLLCFNNSARDALDLIPPVLLPFVQRINLTSSLLQVLNFENEDVMQAALRYIEYYPEVSHLVRDFEVFLPEGLDEGSQDLVDVAGSNDSSTDSSSSSSAAVTAQRSHMGRRLQHPHQLQQRPQEQHALPVERIEVGLDAHVDLSGTAAPQQKHQHQRRLQQGSAAGSTASNDPLLHYQWYLDKINAPAAWQAYGAGSEVVVAVIDTGIDLSHPDLMDRLWTNTKEIPNNGIDDDGNGYIDDVHGFNFNGACLNNQYDYTGTCAKCTGNGNPADTLGHGTHVAGIIAAMHNNKMGIAGVAPRVKIMVLKVLDCKGGIFTSGVFQAFDYALRMGAHIVSCSFGGKYNQGFAPNFPAPAIHASWTESYKRALQPLMDKGILLVAAAGNDNVDLDLLQQHGFAYNPCLVPVGNVLCVMSTDRSDARSLFSNYGTNTTDLAAPGNDMLSTYRNNGYRFLNGTSMATPLVSGAAAMMLSTLAAQRGSPYGKVQLLKELLQSTGQPLEGVPTRSGRRLDLQAALAAAERAVGAAAVAISPLDLDNASTGLMVKGVREVYYNITDAGSSLPIDSSIREDVFPMAAFKHSSGVVLQLTGHMLLPKAGTFVVQVSGASNPVSITVNGQELQVTAGRASVTAKGRGWYLLSVKVQNPSKSIDMQLQQPGAASAGPMCALWQVGYARHAPSAGSVHTQAPTARQVFLVHYSVLPAQDDYNYTAADRAIIQSTASASLPNPADFQQVAVLQALNLTSGSLRQALQPSAAKHEANATSGSGPQGAAVYGLATARLSVMQDAACLVFKLKCEHCTLWIDKMLVLDNWESSSSKAGIAKASSPVNFTSAGRHTLAVAFSTLQLDAASLVLQWAPCEHAHDPAVYTGSAGIESALVWQPEKLVTGWVGGMQCDVWHSPQVGRSTPPSYKVRLPPCSGPQHSASDRCQMRASFQLEQLLPGLALAHPDAAGMAGGTFSVRCWGYTSQQLSAGLSAGPEHARARVWLSATEVGGLAALALHGAPSPCRGTAMQCVRAEDAAAARCDAQCISAAAAPLPTHCPLRLLQVFRSQQAAKDMGGSIGSGGTNQIHQPLLAAARYYRLLVAEWSGISALSVLSLRDGGEPLTLDQHTIRLPLMPVLSHTQSPSDIATGLAAALADYPIAALPVALTAPAATAQPSSSPDSVQASGGDGGAGGGMPPAERTSDLMPPAERSSDLQAPEAMSSEGDGSGEDVQLPEASAGDGGSGAASASQEHDDNAEQSTFSVEAGGDNAESTAQQAGDGTSEQWGAALASEEEQQGSLSGLASMQQLRMLTLHAGHISQAYSAEEGHMVLQGLLPYNLPAASLESYYVSEEQGLSGVQASYAEADGTKVLYTRCLGLWRPPLQLPQMVTLLISHPARQATQVTIGDVSLHSGADETLEEGAEEVVSSRQLLLVPGSYLIDVLARAEAKSTSVAYSISITAPQEHALGNSSFLSLVAQ